MSQKLYLVSLYYDKVRVTGANKRFDEIGRCLVKFGLSDFRVVVTEGNEPEWCPPDQIITVRPYHNKLTRLLSWLHLSWVLLRADRGIVYSDFQPAPVAVDWCHIRYQLIHDLRNWTGFGRGGLGRLTRGFQRHQLRSAAAVVTVSEFTAEDIAEKCGMDRNEIIVSYNGVNDAYQPRHGQTDSANSQQANGISATDALPASSSFGEVDILYIATFEARKNHQRLIEALEILREPCRVVLLGRDLGSLNDIKSYIRQSKALSHITLEIIDALTEAELLALYQATRLFVSPSLFEGFGMPLIEAAACGARVACSDIKVFREIMGEGAYYFDPTDPTAIAKTIAAALSAANPRRVNIERFRWSSITAQLLTELRSRAVTKEKLV